MQEHDADNADVAIREGDRTGPQLPGRIPVVVLLDNLRSAFNVGNIFRLAEATRVRLIVTCGYTATPPHAKLAKTARGCDALTPFRHTPSAVDGLRELRGQGCRIYGVETAAGAQSVWDASFRFPAAFVLGNEALGISREALALCHEFVELPCFGVKNSVNVGNCAAVVLYAALRQWCAQHPEFTQCHGAPPA